jgi:hypothetical protein
MAHIVGVPLITTQETTRYLADRIMDAKAVIHVGIGLICFGIAALTYPSVTSMSKVVENAHQQSSTDNRDASSVPPFVGGLLLIGGVALVAVGAKASPH